MSATDKPQRRRLRPEKRAAIVRAARTAFARDGYVRTATERIAADASVSTRTLYNHFDSKERLFATVLVEGATEVARAFAASTAEIDAATMPAEDCVLRLGHALAAHRLDFPEHFALTQHARTDRDHLPTQLIADWHAAGPQPVEADVHRILTALAHRGDLATDDLDRATFQLILLTAGAIAFTAPPGTTPDEDEIATQIQAGVQTFLYGTTPRT